MSIGETSLTKAINNSLDSSDKKELPVLILAIKKSGCKAQDIDIAMVGIVTYHITYYLIKAQIFAILIKDIKYQDKKKVKAKLIQQILYIKNTMIF